MGRPHAHPHQHLIMRQPDRPSMDKDGLWRDAPSNEQPVATRNTLVLHRHHEHLDDLEGHLSVGQGVRQGQLSELVPARLLHWVEVSG